MHDGWRMATPFTRSSRGSGPSEKKRKAQYSFVPPGPPSLDRRVRGAFGGCQGGGEN